MHDIVVHVAQTRVIGRVTEAWMDGNNDAEFLRPRTGEIEAVPDAGTVEEDERLTATSGEYGGLDAIDGVSLAFETSHGVRAGHAHTLLLI